MAKKSRKRPVRQKRDNAGCMSGLISMFDFRQGRFTRKLLSDRKYGSGKHGGTVYSGNKFDLLSNMEEKHDDVSDTDTKEVGRVKLGKASIRTLMEDEMSRAHTLKKTSSYKLEQIRVELGLGTNLDRNHKKANKNSEVGSIHDANDPRASNSTFPGPSESSSFDINLAELMVEFCSENHKCQKIHIQSIDDWKHNCPKEPDPQFAQKHSILQKTLGDMKEALLTQKSIDPKQITSHGALQSKEFMNALEVLNLNKELFLKLLQDPDSLLVKHIMDLQNAQAGELLNGGNFESACCKPSHKQSRHHFFRKKDKSDGAKQSNDSSSRELKRIVVLKPSPARNQHYSNTVSPISSPKSCHNLQHHEDTERVSSHFSFREIKRRLKNVIGENRMEQHLITMDGILHKIPYGSQSSVENGKVSSSTGQASKLSAFLKIGDNNVKEHKSEKKMNKTTVAHPLYRESVFYEEARKCLDEMLNSDGPNVNPSMRHVSKSLGRILSLPGYNLLSPRFSPGREKETDSTGQMRFSSLQNIKQDDSTNNSPLSQKIEGVSCSDRNPNDSMQEINSHPTLLETQLHIGEDLIKKGSIKIEECDNSDIPVEFSTDGPGSISERCNEEASHMISDSGLSEEVQPQTPSVSILANSILVQKLEAHDNTAENLERPSPVFVLESVFSENINSPGRTETDYDELTSEPRQLRFEEHDNSPQVLTSTISEANLGTSTEDKETKFKYVKTVLETSGLNYNQFSERCQLSDQLLDPFVYDEVEISYSQLIDDSKLLFDCIKEVLVEIQERYSSCTPWISFIKPNIRPIPTGGNFIRELRKGIDQHLHTQFPCTLDQVVKKDLDGGTWMNVRFETENVVTEIGEVILEYIMEETILELWD